MMNKKGNEMTKYAIYQLPETHAMIRDMYFLKPAEIEAISDEYELVGTTEAADLNGVFFNGNVDRDSITVLGDMHSISVGDIIHDLDVDAMFVVERYGFARIMMKEAV
jgi:hypothetical protein